MKIAFFSESTADEAALKILVAGILGEKIEDTDLPNSIIQRSSSYVDKLLPIVIKAVYYNSDAEALVVVSDSDDKPVHTLEHEQNENDKCRLCQLRKAANDTIRRIRLIEGRGVIKVAIGIPVPAIEAWYLIGKNPRVGEASWIRRQNGEAVGYDRIKLKEEAYKTSRPSIELEIKCAAGEAKRIVENELLKDLEDAFPQGFGNLANEIRRWKP
jgi:hypothetical protein